MRVDLVAPSVYKCESEGHAMLSVGVRCPAFPWTEQETNPMGGTSLCRSVMCMRRMLVEYEIF